MKLMDDTSERGRGEWAEILSVAFETGLPRLFGIVWLIDRAEHDRGARPWG
jgi:hypothetical protein